MSPTVQDASFPQRHYFQEESQVIGFVEYYALAHVAIVTHTEVDAKVEGQGYGSKLVQQALDRFAREGRQVVPVCGFFASCLRKNRQYAALVSPESRRIFHI